MKKTHCLIRNRIWLTILTLLLAFTQSDAQSILRQNIGTVGLSSKVDNILLQQTTGQPYSTTGYYEYTLSLRPGFLQMQNTVAEPPKPMFDNDIRIYPNPAVDYVIIESLQPVSNATINITDVSGRTILVAYKEELIKETLNTNSLSGGVYLLSITSEGINLQTTRIIINKK